jgi:hypothetical protein
MDLEDPANEPQYEKILELMVSPEKAPDQPAYVSIDFDKGVPVAVDGEKLAPVDLLKKLNAIAGANGVGLVDLGENRLVGMQSRGIYDERPGRHAASTRPIASSICLPGPRHAALQDQSPCAMRTGLFRPVVPSPARGAGRVCRHQPADGQRNVPPQALQGNVMPAAPPSPIRSTSKHSQPSARTMLQPG